MLYEAIGHMIICSTELTLLPLLQVRLRVRCDYGASRVPSSDQVFIFERSYAKRNLWWNERNLWGWCPIIWRCKTLVAPVQVWPNICWNGSYSWAPPFCHWWRHHPSSGGYHFRRPTYNCLPVSPKCQDKCRVCGKKSFRTICTSIRCLHSRFPGCSLLFRSRNESIAQRLFWTYVKKTRKPFLTDLSHRMKHGSITIVPETKVQSMQWKHFDSTPSMKARVQPSAGKVMLTVFWDQHEVVMTDFRAKGTTITGTYYDSLLHKLREAIKLKRRGMLTREVSHKTMPQSTTLILPRQKHSCGYEIIPHPHYSPDMAPYDFHLFPTMKSFLKRTRFPDEMEFLS